MGRFPFAALTPSKSTRFYIFALHFHFYKDIMETIVSARKPSIEMRLWAWNIHATSPWKPCIEVEELVFFPFPSSPIILHWKIGIISKKKLGQEDTGHASFSVLQRGIASSRCGKRNSWKSLWPLSCPCPVCQEEAAPWYLPFTCSFNLLYVCRLKSIFSLSWNDLLQKITVLRACDIQPFQSEILMKILTLFANCCARLYGIFFFLR